VDHVVSRLEVRHLSEYRAESNQVLSCYRCNQERADAAHRRLGLQYTAERKTPWPSRNVQPVESVLLRVDLTDDVFADFTELQVSTA
jgi:hypothetical protein